jgi:hypothetical protein
MTFGMRCSPALDDWQSKDGGHVEIYDTGNHRIFGVAKRKAQIKRWHSLAKVGL